jgi:hypothetical protein
MRAASLLAVCATATGCLMALPADHDPRHMEIEWRRDFAAAAREARAADKPLLVVGVAGDITGPC